MPKVELYFKDYCPFCHRAKDLLDDKGIEYTLYDITQDADGQAEMAKRKPGARTVPQIFINDQGIGGCDELFALEKNGELDLLLKTA
jgi:glutaredoxin 3